MARGHESDDERDARNGSAALNSSSHNDDALAIADEEAIRAKLRESGWEKKKRAGKDAADETAASPTRKSSDDARDRRSRDERAREKDRESRRRGGDSRRSRSHRRDRDRDDRRERESRRSRRDRSAKRGKASSRRHSSRSRSISKSRSASRSRYSRRRGASRSRSVSKGREKKGTPRRHGASKSRSTSPHKRTTVASKSETRATASEDVEMDSSATGAKGADDSAMDVDVSAEPADGDVHKSSDNKDAPRKSDRGSRKSSRHSRSKSRSPSRTSRRRRHRSSRSRSLSRSRRRRGGSRSASRSRGRRSTGASSSSRRRRRSSRSRSRSRSTSHRRRRRSSSPAPAMAAPPTAPVAAVPTAMAPFAPPLPAATPSVNPSITQLMQQHPTLSLQEIIAKMQASTVSMAAAAAQKPARELYIGNLPTNVTGPQLQEYLSTIIQQVGLTTQPGSPIVNTWLSVDGHFAFCEMRSIDECTLALLLNGLALLGQPLKFGRPRSYMGPPQPYPTISATAQAALASLGCAPSPMWFTATGSASGSAPIGLGGVPPPPLPPQHVVTGAVPPPMPSSAYLANSVAAPPAASPVALPTPLPAAVLSALPADGSLKRLLMSNIPVVLVESQVRELVEPFGSLANFQLVTDSATGASTGNAVFEYETDSAAADALEGLHGLDIGGIPLTVRRANGAVEELSDVLKLANMVALEELANDDEFADLKEDVDEECKRFGSVLDLVIPRPQDGASVPGVGNIYVRFSQQAEAAAALKALSGRKFGGNVVHVTYYPVAKFESKDFA